ncbi:MAG: hypothetical protein LUI07_05175, partial [Lachnospiraceae bacterium]|nr:hypothetical protein [Lachnospiraceae bacterium]
MKRNYLNRSLAIAVAVATTLSSVPVNLAFAEEYTAEEAVVLEDDTVLTEDTANEAAASDGEETASEENLSDAGISVVSVEEIDSADVPEEVAVDEDGIAAIAEDTAQTPGTVTATLDTETAGKLTWTADTAADYYEISMTDANGYDYRYSGSSDYRTSDNISMNLERSSWYAWALSSDGTTLEKAYDSNGKRIMGLIGGTSYMISVRAVNENGEAVAYGEWSNTVTYIPAVVTSLDTITDVKLENDTLSYTYTGKGTVQMRITDANGNIYSEWIYKEDDGTVAYSFPDLNNSTGNLSNYFNSFYSYYYDEDGNRATVNVDGTDLKAFQIGTNYTIELRPYYYQSISGTDLYGDWTTPVSYTPAETAAPEQTGLTYDKNNEEFTWNSVSSASGYELMVTDASGIEYLKDGSGAYNDTSSNRYTRYNRDDNYAYVSTLKNNLSYTDASSGVNIQAFADGQIWSVSVRAYNYKKDGTKQYSEWSAAVAVDIVVSAPGQVTGVAANTTSEQISWNPVSGDSIRYEVMVTDASGVEYYTNSDASLTRYTTRNTSISTATSLYKYTSVDGANTKVLASDGSYVTAFAAGQTYTVWVRAYDTESGLYGEWSSAVTCTVPASAKGSNTTPAAVKNLRIDTDSDEDEGSLTSPVLHWSAIDNVDHYEILIKDAAGNVYSGYTYKNDTFEYDYPTAGTSDYPSINLNSLKNLSAYYKADGSSITTVKGSDGEALKTFEDGTTYKFQVRAVNVYQEWDSSTNSWKDETEYPGAWASAITYTTNAASALTSLKYVSEDTDYYYFSYKGTAVNNAYVYYQIATDKAFTTASLVADWTSYSSTENKFAIGKTSRLKAGTTYYVRAVFSKTAPDDDKVASLNPSVAKFTATAAAAKNITGLYLYKTYSASVEFRFDSVLSKDDNDYYVLQYTTKSSPAESDWAVYSYNEADDSATITTSSLDEGTYYVRAVAYVLQNDEKVYGSPSNVVSFKVSKATTSISNLKLAEKDDSSMAYYFTFTGSPRKNETVQYWISTDSSFSTSDETVTEICNNGGTYGFYISYASLTPGQKYYIRARIVNTKTYSDGTSYTEYSSFTNKVKLTAVMPKISVSSTAVTAKTVTLQMSVTSDAEYLTGYEVQRKSGKNYIAVKKTTNNVVKDTGLTKDTTYTYRVRAYYYNPETGNTKNGSWVYIQTTTWGASLNLKASATSTTSIKLTWSQVSGAEGYEVYRRVTTSSATKTAGSLYNNSNAYAKDVLIKTITKSSTVKYTDKSLNKNLAYTYYVRAYKTVNGQKYYITSNERSVDMNYRNFGSNLVDYVKKSNGKVKVTWSRVYSATGYLIEKYNTNTGKWVTCKTLANSKTSYTFPKTTKAEGVQYRIRAYKGTQYSTALYVTVYPTQATPNGVNSTKSTSTGTIKISWNAVSVAAYYVVYRTTSSSGVYDS